ncbi:ParM/StbA family protein [Margalitia sp. FSL K6-0131]|uniref:ParM/StbA family protein n=1 Tax=Margalitia sp. FSL K6-0131 TaxID=2954604 RepID=UPI0030FB28A8
MSFNIASIDLGNSVVQFKINGRKGDMPNTLALCTEDKVTYYDSSEKDIKESLIVKIDSKSIKNKGEKHYIGISATDKENNSETEKNNKKASQDRSIYMALTPLALDAVQNNTDKNKMDLEIEILTTALPTKQVLADREVLKEKLIGHHTVTLCDVPGRGDVTVNIHIKDCLVAVESMTAFLALSRDQDTLQVKDESLFKETILIEDLGGGSLDPAGFENGKIIDGIKGKVFGINSYLDDIISEVEDETGYLFPSRYSLEQLLIQGKSNWSILVDQQDENISEIISKHFKKMANKYIDEISNDLKRYPKLQNTRRIYPIGGPIKVAKEYIEEENNKRDKPLKFTFAEDINELNLIGLWILAQMAKKKIEGSKEVAASKEE